MITKFNLFENINVNDINTYDKVIYNKDSIRIRLTSGRLSIEFPDGNSTGDVSEAAAKLIYLNLHAEEIRLIEVPKRNKIDELFISPRHSIFYLSGGKEYWNGFSYFFEIGCNNMLGSQRENIEDSIIINLEKSNTIGDLIDGLIKIKNRIEILKRIKRFDL